MEAPIITRLANGVSVLSMAEANAQSAALGVFIAAGTRHERAGEAGGAHYLEHMVFKGAGGRSATEISHAAEGEGIWLNAATAHERTGFHARTIAKSVPKAMELLGDLVARPHLDPADFAQERGVILQEWGEAFDDPADSAGVLHQKCAFHNHPLGKPILGEKTDIETISLDQLIGFKARAWRPEQILVTGIGAIELAQLIEFAEHNFGIHPAPGLSHEEAPLTISSADSAFLESRKTGQSQMVLSFQAPDARDGRALEARFLADILGGGMASRLFVDLRENRGLVYGVDAALDLYQDAGRLLIMTGSAPNSTTTIAQAVMSHLTNLANDGPTDAEMTRVANVMAAGLILGAESMSARMDMAVGEYFTRGAPRTLTQRLARIDSIDKHMVQAMAAEILNHQGCRAAACVGPKAGHKGANWFMGSA